jgi:predicted nucleotidyltransferase
MMEEYNINQTTLKILGLYTGDYGKSLHLREIARETAVDVKAVQLQLRRLERVNVLSSLVRGRNKEFHLNLSNPIARYYLVLAEAFVSVKCLAGNFLVKKVVSEVVEGLSGVVILFGSYAKGLARKNSDVDLLILTEKRLDGGVLAEAGSPLSGRLSVKTMSTARFVRGLKENDPLVREIVSDHVVLKGLDELCDILWRYYAKR